MLGCEREGLRERRTMVMVDNGVVWLCDGGGSWSGGCERERERDRVFRERESDEPRELETEENPPVKKKISFF